VSSNAPSPEGVSAFGGSSLRLEHRLRVRGYKAQAVGLCFTPLTFALRPNGFAERFSPKCRYTRFMT